MQNLKKKLGKKKRAIIRMMKGLPPKYHAYNTIIRHFIHQKNPVIFDVGAHIGESIERFKDIYPDSDIHSFEADEGNFQKLVNLNGARSSVFLNNIAMGSIAGTKIFYKNAKSDTSSFNKVNQDSDWARLRSAQHKLTPDSFTQKAYEVKIGTLDEYMASKNITNVDVLKIDTQGYEDEVLMGAAMALQKGAIKIIEAELIVGNLYEKNLSFFDLEKTLLPHGYKFYAIDRAGDLLHDPSLAFNVLYVHKSLM